MQPTADAAGGLPSSRSAPVIGFGRPPWWVLLLSALVTLGVTVDLLNRGWLERMDLRVSEVVSVWDLRHSDAYWFVWAFTQAGGRGFILIVLAALVGWLAVRRRTHSQPTRAASTMRMVPRPPIWVTAQTGQ